MFTECESKISSVEWLGDFIDIELEDRKCFCITKDNCLCDSPLKSKSWKNILKKGALIRLSSVRTSRVVGLEVWIKDQWHTVWCVI